MIWCLAFTVVARSSDKSPARQLISSRILNRRACWLSETSSLVKYKLKKKTGKEKAKFAARESGAFGTNITASFQLATVTANLRLAEHFVPRAWSS
jgi:hypothetical protein